MKKMLLAAVLVSILLLTACSSGAPKVDPNQSQPTQGAYPAAGENTAYPAQQNAQPNTQGSPAAAYPAQAGDENLLRGEFMVDKVELIANLANPAMTDVLVTGNLPTPCNMMRTNVPGPDSSNVINIELYSVAEKDQVCTQSLMPFQGVVATLGGYPAGKYTVNVNGQKAGEFEVK